MQILFSWYNTSMFVKILGSLAIVLLRQFMSAIYVRFTRRALDVLMSCMSNIIDQLNSTIVRLQLDV